MTDAAGADAPNSTVATAQLRTPDLVNTTTDRSAEPPLSVPDPVNVAHLLHTFGGRCTASPSVGRRADGVKRFRRTGGGRTERNYRTTAPNHGRRLGRSRSELNQALNLSAGVALSSRPVADRPVTSARPSFGADARDDCVGGALAIASTDRRRPALGGRARARRTRGIGRDLSGSLVQCYASCACPVLAVEPRWWMRAKPPPSSHGHAEHRPQRGLVGVVRFDRPSDGTGVIEVVVEVVRRSRDGRRMGSRPPGNPVPGTPIMRPALHGRHDSAVVGAGQLGVTATENVWRSAGPPRVLRYAVTVRSAPARALRWSPGLRR